MCMYVLYGVGFQAARVFQTIKSSAAPGDMMQGNYFRLTRKTSLCQDGGSMTACDGCGGRRELPSQWQQDPTDGVLVVDPEKAC